MNRLDAAADRLRGRWLQGRYHDGDGNVCLTEALAIAGAGLDEFLIVESLIDERSAGLFNDGPSTTEEDVLILLKRASAVYDERHPS